MTTEFQRWQVDSTVEYGTDHYDVTFVGSAPFRLKPNPDTVNLKGGFLSSTGTPQTITVVGGGPVDEFEIAVDHQRIVGQKHGRDAIASAFDSLFEKRYYRFPEAVPPDVDQFDSTNTKLPAPPPGVSGIFKASQIAKEAAASAGLTLEWGIPDYEVQRTFFASGRAIDTITRLVRPYTTVAPFQADVVSEGTAVQVLQRRGVDVPAADFTISLADMRRSSLTARVRRTATYRRVSLLGRANDTGKDAQGVFIEGEQTLVRQDDRFNAAEKLIERIITMSRLSTPSNRMLVQVVEHYAPNSKGALALTSRQATDNVWEPVAIGAVGPVAQQKLTSSTIRGEGYDAKKVWRTLTLDEKGFSYDGNGLETGSTDLLKKLNSKTNALDPSKLTSITKNDIGTALVEVVTETYGFQKSKFQANVLVPVLRTRVSDQQGGFRPGGPGRAFPQTRGSAAGAQLSLVRTVDASGAVDVNESFADLDLNALKAIMEYYRAASGVWEYEVIFVGVNMPWIKRGQYLRVTDFESEVVGTNIALPVMLVADVVTDYTEEKPDDSKFVSKIRCIGWSAS